MVQVWVGASLTYGDGTEEIVLYATGTQDQLDELIEYVFAHQNVVEAPEEPL